MAEHRFPNLWRTSKNPPVHAGDRTRNGLNSRLSACEPTRSGSRTVPFMSPNPFRYPPTAGLSCSPSAPSDGRERHGESRISASGAAPRKHVLPEVSQQIPLRETALNDVLRNVVFRPEGRIVRKYAGMPAWPKVHHAALQTPLPRRQSHSTEGRKTGDLRYQSVEVQQSPCLSLFSCRLAFKNVEI
jgi:hypothetical protein